MDDEFHYAITKALVLCAGVTETKAEIIAYASQFIDNNTRPVTIDTGLPSTFTSRISQSYFILRPSAKLQALFLMYHFIPGDTRKSYRMRKDGRRHPWMVTPDSRNAQAILRRSLQSGNLYRIGLALHSYADTWSHTHFTGTLDTFNAFPGLRAALIPNIGHADAGHLPDLPGISWKDPRLQRQHQMIHNALRFLHASRRMFEELALWQGHSPHWIHKRWRLLKQDLREVFSPAYSGNRSRKKRLEFYRNRLGVAKRYHSLTWFKEAVTMQPGTGHYRFLPGYRKSHWYRFQQALVSHEALCREILAPYLETLEKK